VGNRYYYLPKKIAMPIEQINHKKTRNISAARFLSTTPTQLFLLENS